MFFPLDFLNHVFLRGSSVVCKPLIGFRIVVQSKGCCLVSESQVFPFLCNLYMLSGFGYFFWPSFTSLCCMLKDITRVVTEIAINRIILARTEDFVYRPLEQKRRGINNYPRSFNNKSKFTLADTLIVLVFIINCYWCPQMGLASVGYTECVLL